MSKFYLDVSPAGDVLDVVLGADFRFGLLLEVQLDGFYFLFAAFGFVGGVF